MFSCSVGLSIFSHTCFGRSGVMARVWVMNGAYGRFSLKRTLIGLTTSTASTGSSTVLKYGALCLISRSNVYLTSLAVSLTPSWNFKSLRRVTSTVVGPTALISLAAHGPGFVSGPYFTSVSYARYRTRIWELSDARIGLMVFRSEIGEAQRMTL